MQGLEVVGQGAHGVGHVHGSSPDPDPHWLGYLDPDPHRDKKAVPGSTTLLTTTCL
jgi:hypothetical protein